MKFLLFESEDKAKQVLEEGKPRQVLVKNMEICIVRKNDQLFAFQNLCTHMGASLNQGNINHLNEIVCPLHTYRFNMTTGEESESRCNPLKIYPIIQSNDGVYIDVD
ncbi:Rieske (2Fe-2S) protein [Ekhidna sp.]